MTRPYKARDFKSYLRACAYSVYQAPPKRTWGRGYEHTRVDAQEKEVCRSIEQSFEALKGVLDKQKTELVKKSNKISLEKKNYCQLRGRCSKPYRRKYKL